MHRAMTREHGGQPHGVGEGRYQPESMAVWTVIEVEPFSAFVGLWDPLPRANRLVEHARNHHRGMDPETTTGLATRIWNP